MKYTMKQIQATLKRIRKIKPQCNTNYDLSLKETILFMAPVLVEKKEEGVSISQLVEELANDGFVIGPPAGK